MVNRIGKIGLQTSFVISPKAFIKQLQKKKKIQRGGNDDNFTDCQKSIDDSIETDMQWIQLVKILQNLRGKGIATMLGKIATQHAEAETEVVVKVQMDDNAQHELAVQSVVAGLPNFVKYHCSFKCDGDKTYIEEFSTFKEQQLCRAGGTSMGVIVMPFYPNGSLEDQLKAKPLSPSLDMSLVITSVVRAVFKAFIEREFTHGDLFCKNILLDQEWHPIITDFERSEITGNASAFWRDLDAFFGDLDYIWRTVFRRVGTFDGITRKILETRAYLKPPSPVLCQEFVNMVILLFGGSSSSTSGGSAGGRAKNPKTVQKSKQK